MKRTTAKARELRQHATHPEMLLWMAIRNRALDGYKFRRQTPIGPFIVDFVCKQTQLIIEVDGESHDRRISYDLARTRYLVARGYKVIRFSNEDVTQSLDGVISRIRDALDS